MNRVLRAMKKYPGCVVFAHDVSDMLNIHLRPVTAKRHRAHAEDRRIVTARTNFAETSPSFGPSSGSLRRNCPGWPMAAQNWRCTVAASHVCEECRRVSKMWRLASRQCALFRRRELSR